MFAVVRQGPKLLVGVAREHPRWAREWCPQYRIFSTEELAEQWRISRLPSTYLREGERPEEALTRVLADQLGVSAFSAGPAWTFSYLAPSGWYPGRSHWDLVFAFPVRARPPALRPEWWSRLEMRDFRTLRPSRFGWNDDLVRDIGARLRADSPAQRARRR